MCRGTSETGNVALYQLSYRPFDRMGLEPMTSLLEGDVTNFYAIGNFDAGNKR